jgi:hypothetical protein
VLVVVLMVITLSWARETPARKNTMPKDAIMLLMPVFIRYLLLDYLLFGLAFCHSSEFGKKSGSP